MNQVRFIPKIFEDLPTHYEEQIVVCANLTVKHDFIGGSGNQGMSVGSN